MSTITELEIALAEQEDKLKALSQKLIAEQEERVNRVKALAVAKIEEADRLTEVANKLRSEAEILLMPYEEKAREQEAAIRDIYPIYKNKGPVGPVTFGDRGNTFPVANRFVVLPDDVSDVPLSGHTGLLGVTTDKGGINIGTSFVDETASPIYSELMDSTQPMNKLVNPFATGGQNNAERNDG